MVEKASHLSESAQIVLYIPSKHILTKGDGDIKHHLEEILDVLKDVDQLTEMQHQHIANSLREIAISKDQFQKGMKTIEAWIGRFAAGDENKINELTRRYHATNDANKKSEIGKEYQLEKRKIEIFDFWKSHQGNVDQFLNHFDQYIHNAATFMEQNNPKEAVSPIRSAIQIIDKIHAVLIKLKSHERYIISLSKKEQKVEKKEKEGK